MKKIILAFSLATLYLSVNAQKINSKTVEKRIAAIEDRMAIKNLVDTFSILADTKDVQKQILLFTGDAKVETMSNGKVIATLAGRKEIENAFSNFLGLFDVVYHINGQQTVTLEGEKASGISYCAVTLIGKENGKKMKTLLGVYYHDEYVKKDGKWLISNRQSTFAWQDKQEMAE